MTRPHSQRCGQQRRQTMQCESPAQSATALHCAEAAEQPARISTRKAPRIAAWCLSSHARESASALVDGHERARLRAEVHLAWARDLLLGVAEHLFPLAEPAGCAADREE